MEKLPKTAIIASSHSTAYFALQEDGKYKEVTEKEYFKIKFK